MILILSYSFAQNLTQNQVCCNITLQNFEAMLVPPCWKKFVGLVFLVTFQAAYKKCANFQTAYRNT